MPVHAEDHASFIQAFDVLKFGSRFYPEAGAVLVKAGVHDQSFDPKNNIDVATVRQRIRTLTDVEVGDLDVDSTTFGTDGSEAHYTTWLQDTGLTYIDRLVIRVMGEGMKDLRRKVSDLHGEVANEREYLRNMVQQLDDCTRTYYEKSSTGTASPQHLNSVILHLYKSTKHLLQKSSTN